MARSDTSNAVWALPMGTRTRAKYPGASWSSELARRPQGFVGCHVGDGDAARRRGLVQVRARNGAASNQAKVALVLGFIVCQLRFVLSDLGFRLVHEGLIGPRVKLEKHVALLDERALFEVDLVEIAPH